MALHRTAMLLAALAPSTFGLPAAARAADAAIGIDNFTFAPATLTVSPGTKVVWINRDDIPHTVVSDATPPLFRSHPLDTGDAFSMVFASPGTYRYFCGLHPHMQGTIVVR